MHSFAARRRRKAFMLKSHTSPTLTQDNSNEDLTSSKKADGTKRVEERLSLPNVKELSSSISDPATLAQETKVKKRSKLKVLLSPRNPYEEFHKLFTNIPKEEFPINDYSCALSRDILLHGRLFLSQNWLCFYSNIFGFETVVKLELRKLKSIVRAKTAYMFPNAILIRTEKKKYLFCSFLMRDAAHKLLTTIWQESTNSKPDSGVDEAFANGDQDEEESENLEEIAEYNENEPPVSVEDLQTPKDPTLWNLSQHHRTVSCPNTPLTHHSSIEEKSEISTVRNHSKDHRSLKHLWSLSSFQTFSGRMAKHSFSVIKNIYNWLSPIKWLFKRNKLSAEVFLLVASFLLILLLLSTYVLMDRIAKLEHRFHRTLPSTDQYLLTDEQSTENWAALLKEHDMRFLEKTERFNEGINGLILSVQNVQSKLNKIKDELET